MSGTAQSVIRMANDIARNFAVQGDERAAVEAAQHIIDYWAPSMRKAILSADHTKLSRIARVAVGRIGAC